MAKAEYKITEAFEREVAKYTGAPYAIAIDNCSNALFLCLVYEEVQGQEVFIPAHTYPSVPCEIIHAGGRVRFKYEGYAQGAYQLYPTRVWDSALRFTYDMYIEGSLMCVSFTGPHKRVKLGKGGMILTDDKRAYEWFKRARMSGRREKNYNEDHLDMLGWNFYMLPEIAVQGLRLMRNMYDMEGNPKRFDDIEVKYPDLSRFAIYTNYEHRD